MVIVLAADDGVGDAVRVTVRRRVTALALRRTALRRVALAGRRVGFARFRVCFVLALALDVALDVALDFALARALALVLGPRRGRLFRAIWLLPSRLVDLGC